MRIIVTSQGNYEVADIANSLSPSRRQTNRGYNSTTNVLKHINGDFNKSNTNIPSLNTITNLKTHHKFSTRNKLNKSKSVLNMLNNSKILDRNELMIDKKELIRAKEVTLHQKLKLPHKEIIKYSTYRDDDETPNEERMNKIKESLTSNKTDKTFFSEYMKDKNANQKKDHNLKLLDILSPKAYNTIKTNFFNKEAEKTIQSRIMSPQSSRTIYRDPNDEIEKMNEYFNKKISKDRIDLINYLKNKEELSIQSLKNIHDSDKWKIFNLNKICKKIKTNDTISKFDDLYIKEKLIARNKKLQKSCSQTIMTMSDTMKKTQSILNGYNKDKFDTNVLILKQYVNDMRNHYWNKHNSEFLERDTISQRIRKRGKLNFVSKFGNYNNNTTSTIQIEDAKEPLTRNTFRTMGGIGSKKKIVYSVFTHDNENKD